MNYLETSLGSDKVEGPLCQPGRKTVGQKIRQRLDRFIEQQWAELPYVMMRITAGIPYQRAKRFHWRDQSVQCGEIELNLVRSGPKDGTFVYTAIYSREDYAEEESHHDFLVPIQASLEGRQLRWAAPALCGTAKLTLEDLAEVLLAQLVKLEDS